MSKLMIYIVEYLVSILPYEENYFPQATESRSVKNKDGETSTRPRKGDEFKNVDPTKSNVYYSMPFSPR